MHTALIRQCLIAGLLLIGGRSGNASAEDGSATELWHLSISPDQPTVSFVEGLVLPGPAEAQAGDAAEAGRVRRAVGEYLRQVEEIERHAAEERASARARLLEALGQEVSGAPIRMEPGLIGGSTINGEKAGIVYHYHHGRLLAAEQIRSRFHGADAPLPSVRIELVGYVNVPRDMTVKIWHAAGGVNGDHGELSIDDHLIGTVGDDLAKNVIYLVTLPQGTHRVKWVLTGGLFQNNLLRFEDPQSEALLSVFHDVRQREAAGADTAREIVEGDHDPAEWSIAVDPRAWRWDMIGE